MKKLAIFLLFSVVYMNFSFAQATCDYKVEILADGDEFEAEEFKWRMKATKIEGKSTNITGTAKIEDSGGRAVKSYKPWTSQSISKQKTSSEYSPNLKPGEYKITAEIKVECDDTDKSNNEDEKEIEIKGEIKEKTSKSSKNDEETADEGTGGEQRQQTAKTTQTAAKEKPSKQATEELENTVELKSQAVQRNKELPATANIISNEKIETVYASSNERAKGWIMALLLTISVLLNIILIWKR
ncbi:hypothetical protein HYV80_04730 [Candidatus Woesearchaeota archaeon]|nr:hypothetical protein [Candidatus Woesearchaeota archaeon]